MVHVAAVESGVLKMSDLQKGLIANYKVLMRLGLFDDPSDSPWVKYGPSNVNTASHQRLALEGRHCFAEECTKYIAFAFANWKH